MEDRELMKIGEVLDKRIKPLHGEVARITRELRDLKLDSTKTSIGLHKVGKELARIDSNLETITDKTDALLADVSGLQDTTEAIWDKISVEGDKLKREVEEIREHVGLG